MLSKRAKQIMLHTGIVLTMTMTSTALPHPVFSSVPVEASTIISVSGTLTVLVPSLWAYSAPDWSARSRTYSEGTVLQVVERHTVEGRGMYRLSNGLYITANTAYVSFVPLSNQVLNQTAAQADDRITTVNLNLRSGAGTGFSVLLTIPQGTKVRVTSESGGWAKITYAGKTGYASASFLEKIAPPVVADSRETTVNLNLRSGAGTSFPILATIPRGTEVRVDSEKDGWAKVTFNGVTGFVSAEYLKALGTLEPEPTPKPTPEPLPVSSDFRDTTVNLNLRSGAGTSFSILATIPQGTEVRVDSEKDGWAKVTFNGVTGFVSAEYLKTRSTTEPEPTPTPPPAPADLRETTVNLNLRSGAGTSFAILATIPQGTEVRVDSEKDGWAKVTFNGVTGFVSAEYLKTRSAIEPEPTPTPPPAPADLRETTVNLNLRSGAGTSFAILGTIPRGTVLTVEEESGGWAKVRHEGQVGFVSSEYLQSVETNEPEPEPVPEPEPEPEPQPPVLKQYITLYNLNLRAGSGTEFAIVTTIPQGTTVTVEAEEAGWGKVSFAGQTGYVSMTFLEEVRESVPEPAPVLPDLWEATVNLNLREEAGTTYRILATIPSGTELTIEEAVPGWVRTSYQGLVGYVAAEYLKKVGSTSPPGEEVSAQATVLMVESPQGSVSYEDVRVAGYVLSALELSKVEIRVNGNLIGTAAIKIPRLDLEAQYPEYPTAGESGYTLLLGRDRFLKGTNQVTVDALFLNGTRVSKTVNIQMERPDAQQEAGLDDMDVVNYGNVDIAVTGFALMEAEVQSVRVFLNGNPQGSAQTGLERTDRNGEKSGFRYVIKRNNLFPGENALRVEITSMDGSKISYSKTLQVEKVPVIVIDAGHGGKDSGARGILNGVYVYEKNLVLQHALRLNEELKKLGFKTVMTRTDDRFIELADRASIANQQHADLFLSLHHNYNANESSQGGFLIYPSYKLSSISESVIKESIDAAGYLKKALVDSGFLSRRDGTDVSISGHTLAVLRQTQMRSLLAEIGYVSNMEDLLRLNDPVYQQSVAYALAKQIEAYFLRK